MPFYQDLKHRKGLYGNEDPTYIAGRLLHLRRSLSERIPERELRRTLIIGSWNIRDFDSNKFGQGPRRQESFHYIAEILSRFDICAVQEVNDDLRPLKRVISLLGPSYQYMVTDITMGRSGNNERLAFIYDTRKVQFRNEVGEIVLPPARGAESRQIARTPFFAAFQAGWFRFTICTAHIYFGKSSPNSEGYKRRVEEIATLSKLLAKRSKDENQTYIFLGDFNVVSQDDATMKALKAGGFQVPPDIRGTNLGGDRDYDQIAFRPRDEDVKCLGAGVFDWRDAVFRDEDFPRYRDAMPAADDEGAAVAEAAREAHYRKKWQTWQMSDHKPLWVQLEVDFSDRYLAGI